MRLKRKAKRITPGIRVKKYNEGGVFAPREDVDPEPENELKIERCFKKALWPLRALMVFL